MADKAWSQTKLSEKAGISTGTIDNIFGSKAHTVYTMTLAKIAKALEVPLDDLILAATAETGLRKPPPLQNLPRIRMGRFPATLDRYPAGRETELERLDAAWADPHVHILLLIGMGGIGKTSLIKHWLNQGHPNYRGAERIFAWSFAGQSRRGMASMSDRFITECLRWFGDPHPIHGSWYDRAYRLAELIREYLTLLILDGLEALQSPPGTAAGCLAAEEPLLVLLSELAQQHSGLCLVSSRLTLKDLSANLDRTVREIPLQELTDSAGEKLLRQLGVAGSEPELRAVVRDCWGHPLCLSLIGRYIADAYADKSVRHLKPISTVLPLADQREMGRACQIMEEYMAWLDPAGLAVLRLLSLFECSVETEWLDQFRHATLIYGLTEPLQEMSRENLRCVCADLRKSELVMEVKRQEQDALDLHPLVRSFFREQLKQNQPDIYREALRYLFEIERTSRVPG